MDLYVYEHEGLFNISCMGIILEINRWSESGTPLTLQYSNEGWYYVHEQQKISRYKKY
jgi:hypothetical protein